MFPCYTDRNKKKNNKIAFSW